MAGVKISALPTSPGLDGTELVPVVDGGATQATTTQDIADLGGVSWVWNPLFSGWATTLGPVPANWDGPPAGGGVYVNLGGLFEYITTNGEIDFFVYPTADNKDPVTIDFADPGRFRFFYNPGNLAIPWDVDPNDAIAQAGTLFVIVQGPNYDQTDPPPPLTAIAALSSSLGTLDVANLAIGGGIYYRAMRVSVSGAVPNGSSPGIVVMPTNLAIAWGNVEWGGTVTVPTAGAIVTLDLPNGSGDQVVRVVNYAYLAIKKVADATGAVVNGAEWFREQAIPSAPGSGFIVFDNSSPDNSEFTALLGGSITITDPGTYGITAFIIYTA